MVILHMRQVNRVAHVMALGIHTHFALRPVGANATTFQRFAHCDHVRRFGLFCSGFVNVDRVIGVSCLLGDIRLIRELGFEALLEVVAGGRVNFLDVVGRHVHVFQRWRLEPLVLVRLAHLDRTAHRQIQVRSSLLLKVRRLQIAHQQRHHKVRLDLLDVLDGLAELVHAQRNELFAHHGAAVFLDDFADPLR